MDVGVISSVTNSKVVEGQLPCPKCPSSDAYHIYGDGHGYCFSCEYYNPPKRSAAHSGTDSNSLVYTYEYLPWRGVSKDTFKTYNVLTKINSEGKPVSIGFRYPNGDIQARSLEQKDFYWVKGGSDEPAGLFGQDKFTPGASRYVTVTEGALDAASCYQVLGGPSVGVHSASSAVRDCTRARSWLNSYERIYLALDNDAVGREALAAVARLFDRDKVFHVKFGHRKDANEYLSTGEGEELKRIWWNSKKYLPENIKSSLDDFKKALEDTPKMGAPYPFPKLTEMTYGIRPGELVLITAQEKVGKTELMHSILHKLLKETGHDTNIGALFHEESDTRTLQSLAGIELGRPVHLPDSGVAQDQVTATVDTLVGRDDRLFLHSLAGNTDPESLLDTLRFLAAGCSCKYILWDHPGMAVFGSRLSDERQTLDYLAAGTELLTAELGFGLIVVCHVNDFGQIRGSRYFGKACSVRIDLTRDTANADPTVARTVNVTLPYQRFGWRTGPVGSYVFEPDTQKYTEITHDQREWPETPTQAEAQCVTLVPADVAGEVGPSSVLTTS